MAKIFIFLLALIGFTTVPTAYADVDAEGCSDVFVTRLTAFIINDCETKDFDTHVFAEGRRTNCHERLSRSE